MLTSKVEITIPHKVNIYQYMRSLDKWKVVW